MLNLKFIRKVASILLVLCFVLPLSKCAGKIDPVTGVAQADVYRYGYVIFAAAWENIQQARWMDGVMTLLALFNVFFLPLFTLRLNTSWQAFANFFGGFSAGYVLFWWAFFFVTTPLIGGLLAVGCWIILFIVSTIEIGRCLRNRFLGKRELSN